jgi:hypothetical protein
MSETAGGKKLDKSPSTVRMDGKELDHRSKMSGTSIRKIEQAFKTFENVTGPGEYDTARNLNGRTLSNSKMKNLPSFSIG